MIEKSKIALNLDTNVLKLIGIITMTCDHAGKMLFPDIMILQILGRIAFPIFAYCLVVGSLYTHNIKRYILRLSIFAVISQFFYALSDWQGFFEKLLYLNIFFTLILGLIAIYSIQKRKWWLLAICFLATFFLHFDYGISGVILMLSFYLFRNKPIISAILVALQLGVSFIGDNDFTVLGIALDKQGFSILSMLFIYMKTNSNLKINKYVFYLFYPLHFLILYLIGFILR